MRPTLTGNLPDVRPAIAGSAVCVVPLRIGGGTRLKILQAMALGTPVVSTSKGAEGLDVTPGRDILIGDTPDAFAAQVVRLLNDAALADTLSAGRQGPRAVPLHLDALRRHPRRGGAAGGGERGRDTSMSDAPRIRRVLARVAGLACLIAAATAVPYLYGWSVAGPDRVYTGLMFDVPDHAQVPGRGSPPRATGCSSPTR